MKFNLKTIPKDVMQTSMRKWLEGFEAELRGILKLYDRMEGALSLQQKARQRLIKEILGENDQT